MNYNKSKLKIIMLKKIKFILLGIICSGYNIGYKYVHISS